MKKNFFVLTLTCLCGCSAAPAPVLVGHVASFTGADKVRGENARRGIRLALAAASNNKKNKVGAPIVVLHANAPPTREAFAAEAVRLTRINKTPVLFGGWTVEETTGLERGRVPVLAFCGLRGRQKERSVFLTGLTPQRKGELLAKFAAGANLGKVSPKSMLGGAGAGALLPGAATFAAVVAAVASQAKPPRVLVLSELDNKEHAEAADAFVRAYRKLGPEPLHLRYADDGQLTQRIKLARRHVAEMIFLAGGAQAADAVRSSFKGIPLLFAGSEEDRDPLLRNPRTGDDVYLVTAWIKDRKTKQNRRFVERHRKLFGQDPDVHAALAWDGMQLLLAALLECRNDFTPKQIQKKLGKVKDVPLLSGAASFDKDGILRRPALLVRLEKGRIVLIERSDPPN